jgi:hypothetical protein
MVLRGIVYWGFALVILLATRGRIGWKKDEANLFQLPGE